MSTEAKPFLKWAGGKGQLLGQLSEHLPKRIKAEPFTYIEPFVGGGAMLFYMLQHFDTIRKAVINDVNEDLVLTYRIIKDDVESLITNLDRLEKNYLAITDQDGRGQIFYEVRERYNQHVGDTIDRVSQLLFLNKTCFNGLYRVNRKGQFNVPFGKYSNPTICNAKILRADSRLLQSAQVEICHGDYTLTSMMMTREPWVHSVISLLTEDAFGWRVMQIVPPRILKTHSSRNYMQITESSESMHRVLSMPILKREEN